MEDRELIEAAAMAAGFALTQWPDEDYPRAVMSGNWCPPFRPLSDDGDALRLAVRLSIEVQPYLLSGITCAGHVLRPHQRIEELHAGDSMAATRRAIVRAAAAMSNARAA